MKTPIGTAHGWLSLQPDGRWEFRPLSSTPGPWELFDFPGLGASVPVPPGPIPPPAEGPWLGIPPQQTAEYVAQVKAALLAQGHNLSGPCGAFDITANVAWGLRGQGAGVLAKPGGNNCGGYATDIVCWPDHAIDILGDGGGANTPLWAPTGVDDLAARWRAPIHP